MLARRDQQASEVDIRAQAAGMEDAERRGESGAVGEIIERVIVAATAPPWVADKGQAPAAVVGSLSHRPMQTVGSAERDVQLCHGQRLLLEKGRARCGAAGFAYFGVDGVLLRVGFPVRLGRQQVQSPRFVSETGLHRRRLEPFFQNQFSVLDHFHRMPRAGSDLERPAGVVAPPVKVREDDLVAPIGHLMSSLIFSIDRASHARQSQVSEFPPSEVLHYGF